MSFDLMKSDCRVVSDHSHPHQTEERLLTFANFGEGPLTNTRNQEA